MAAFAGDDLVGWWPFVRSQAACWSVLRPMGCGPSDYLHPLTRDCCPAVANAMRSALDEQQLASIVDLHQLRPDLAGELVDGNFGHAISQTTCLVLDLRTGYDDYVRSLSKSLRYDVRRLDKPPFSSGEASIVSSTPETVQRDLDVLFDLHARRWRRRWQPGAFTARHQAFHREWANLAAASGRLRLSTLLLGGQPVGAIYCMSLGGSTYYYQAGVDPAHRSISPGTLLIASAVKNAVEEEHTRFDFLRGDEAYKRRWNPQTEYTNFRIVMAPRGFGGSVAARWQVIGNRIEVGIRARLERHG